MIRAILPLCLLVLGACAGKTEAPISTLAAAPSFAPATLIAEPPDPFPTVALPEPMPIAMLEISPSKPKPSEKQPPTARVDNANREALREPSSDGYRHAVQIYPYAEGALYRLYAAPERVTDIMLQPGEQVSSVAAGDTVRWTVGDTASGSGTERRTHVLVKPFAPGLATNLVITTDRRAYHLAMESTASTAMAAIRWTYPQDELIALQRASVEAARTAPVASGIAIEDLNFAYEIEGDTPAWRPLRVFDDGRQVFIEFAEGLGAGEAPPLFVLGAKGEAQLVNYRVRGRYYIVDRLFEAAELRLGEREQQVVRIVKDDSWGRQ
ncbi:MAG: P-type conjugative transfer protein TrbG [Pseudomonadota bacterium]